MIFYFYILLYLGFHQLQKMSTKYKIKKMTVRQIVTLRGIKHRTMNSKDVYLAMLKPLFPKKIRAQDRQWLRRSPFDDVVMTGFSNTFQEMTSEETRRIVECTLRMIGLRIHMPPDELQREWVNN